MNLTYIIGVVGAIAVTILGIIINVTLGASPPVTVNVGNLMNFFDIASA